MLEELKQEVCEANLELVEKGVVIYTWGNVSGIDRESGLVVIKPSGVAYESLTPEDMVVLTLAGQQVGGSLKPSSDLRAPIWTPFTIVRTTLTRALRARYLS